jgi:carboxypeptidase B
VQTAELAEKMKTAIKAVHGHTYTSEHAAELYCASGGADDWFYAVPTKRAVAGGLCIELRDTGRYGFLLPESEIIPTGQETLQAVLTVAEDVIARMLR